MTFTRARVVSPSQPQVDSIIEARLRPEPDLSDEQFVRQALSDANAARAAGKPRRAALAKELGVDGTIDTVTLRDEELTALKNEELKALLRGVRMSRFHASVVESCDYSHDEVEGGPSYSGAAASSKTRA